MFVPCTFVNSICLIYKLYLVYPVPVISLLSSILLWLCSVAWCNWMHCYSINCNSMHLFNTASEIKWKLKLPAIMTRTIWAPASKSSSSPSQPASNWTSEYSWGRMGLWNIAVFIPLMSITCLEQEKNNAKDQNKRHFMVYSLRVHLTNYENF